MMLFGLNGNGKSSFAQRMMYSMAARGIAPAIFDPIKNEHGQAVTRMGGDVIRIGPNSVHKINLLDLGALGDAGKSIGGTLGAEMRQQAIAKVVDLVTLVVQISRGRPLEDSEDAALAELIRSVLNRFDVPWMGDLLGAFNSPPPEVLHATVSEDATEFRREYRALHKSLNAMLTGPMGALVGNKDSLRLSIGNPGGFCFDTSSIPESNTKLLSAAMLATWTIGFATIDAHYELSRHDPSIYWGGYLAVQDEFWYPMRACEGIIDRADRLGRTNRGLGISELKITHSPKDFLSLPNEKDRATAKGFTERSPLLGLMALSRSDLVDLSDIQPMNAREIDTVASFNAPPSWKPDLDSGGNRLPPPGAGKILLKVNGRVGIAVQTTLTAIERDHHIADARSNTAVRQRPTLLQEEAAP
ncbi:ATP-binding protein [Arthrobacter echini]|uniref:ATP-binding protein n=1 Tax=Arthrobacter echini TaxID=1529066 RepID=A0A5D0XJ61_9MICC|nr:ATP-binding protein [Arthrobacter echini]TYC96594.1 ATP-binding protein [Arthrobacter echini]